MQLTINKIILSHSTRRIEYTYTYDKGLAKFFNNDPFFAEYDVSLETVPQSILGIPLLANVMPVAWFAGFDVKIDCLDRDFYAALKDLKTQFTEFYPAINARESHLIVDQITDRKIESPSQSNAMLFSGGVDAYATFFRHLKEPLDLITIRGADMDIDDETQWENVVSYNNNTAVLTPYTKHYITSNFREFLTFEVDKLLPNLGWWGKVQHGLALTALTAPLAYFKHYKMVYIASSRSDKQKLSPWGSLPHIDNKVRWNGTKIIHDGYNLTRLDKIKTIIENSNDLPEKPKLRVCYNEFKEGLNCSHCEKCVRTIFALLINGQNPRDYGFEINKRFYTLARSKIQNGFKTQGTKLFWQEMFDFIQAENLFILSNPQKDYRELDDLKTCFEGVKNEPVGVINKAQRLKSLIINKFPKTFKTYLKLRQKL